MLAVRPNYHSPALTAKALSTLDVIAPGRISLNVVSSWWKDEATQYGAPFDVHDARYARTSEWLDIVGQAAARGHRDSHSGLAVPDRRHDPGAEAERSRRSCTWAASRRGQGDHRGSVGRVRDARRRARGDRGEGRRAVRAAGARPGKPPLQFGVSGYVICRDTEAGGPGRAGPDPERAGPRQRRTPRTGLHRGLAAGVAGLDRGVQRLQPGPAQRADRHARPDHRADPGLRERRASTCSCFSSRPQREEMARFGSDVIALPGTECLTTATRGKCVSGCSATTSLRRDRASGQPLAA